MTTKRGGRPRTVTPTAAVVGQIVARYENGEPGYRLADEYGLPRTQVYDLLHSLDIPIRRQGRIPGLNPNPGPAKPGWQILTETDVAALRRRYRLGRNTLRSLAADYGVSHETIRKAITGETWSHVPDPAPTTIPKRARHG